MPSLPIDRIVRDARVFNPKVSMPDIDIGGAVRELFTALDESGIDYRLVGGVALLAYVEGRNTQDVDLIVDPADLGRLPWNATALDGDFAKAAFRGIDVDLLLTTNALFLHVRDTEPSVIRFHDLQIPSVTRVGLLLLKLYALPSLYRQGKLARAALYETDVLMLRQGQDVDDGALLGRLAPHVARHDLDELARILGEQRSRTRFS